VTSRRKAEALILAGRVTVNGRRMEELGTKADLETDHIKVDGKLIRPEPKEYIAFHKPRSVLSAVSDARGRKVATDYVPGKKRLYPAGRLDFNSEGLLILTNDGAMARRITAAGNHEKIYRVKVRGVPSRQTLDQLRDGISVAGEVLAAHKIRTLKLGSNSWFEVVLMEGRNRQIRRMFEIMGHSVMRLRRIAIGPVRLGQLKPGQYRPLSEREVALLSREKPSRRRRRRRE